MPPQSAASRESTNKRQRASTACENCRRKKIRCDTGTPKCGHCVSGKLECKYIELRKKPKNPQRRAEVGRRLDRIERALEALLGMQGGQALGVNSAKWQPENEGDSEDEDEDSANEDFENDSPQVIDDRSNVSKLTSSTSPPPNNTIYGQATAGNVAPLVMPVYRDETSRLAALSGAAAMAPPASQIQANEESETYDEPPPNFNHIDACITGDKSQPPPADMERYYSHSIHNILFSQKAMDYMQGRMKNKHLANRLQSYIANLATAHHELYAKLNEMISAPGTVDPQIIDEAIKYYGAMPSTMVNLLLKPEELRLYREDPNLDNLNGLKSGRQLLVYAVVSLLTSWLATDGRFSLFSPEYLQEQSRIAIILAIRAAQRVMLTKPNITLLRGIVFLVLAATAMPMPPVMIHYAIMAVHTAHDIGLNRASMYEGLPEDDRIRRLVLWSFVVFLDSDVAIKFGRPATASIDEDSAPMFPNYSLDTDLCVIAPGLELNRLYLKIYQRLFSVKSESKHKMEFIEDVMICDQELRDWYDNLPPAFLLDENGNTAPELLSSPQACSVGRVLHFHMLYHQLNVLIYRNTVVLPAPIKKQLQKMRDAALNGQTPDTGSEAGQYGSPKEPKTFTHTQLSRLLRSMSICSVSARRTLLLCQRAIEHEVAIAAGVVLVATSAVVALFMKGVILPDSNNHSDSILIREIASFFNSRQIYSAQLQRLGGGLWATLADIVESCHKPPAGPAKVERPKSRHVYHGAQPGELTESPSASAGQRPPVTVLSPQSTSSTSNSPYGVKPGISNDHLDEVSEDFLQDMDLQLTNDIFFMSTNIYGLTDSV